MRENQNHNRIILRQATCLGLALATVLAIAPFGFAESLFRASASYSASAPYTPRSLYTQPRPANVGDIITVQIDETIETNSRAELRIQRSQDLQENNSTIYNNIIHKLGIPNHWSFPNLNGVSNSNDLTSRVDNIRTTRVREPISCQVVEVLPNGNLVVQGKKTRMNNKEREDVIVTGIINPYYLDRNNTIQSRQVANFQMFTSGKGVMSRQQNDGLAGKLFQFYN